MLIRFTAPQGTRKVPSQVIVGQALAAVAGAIKTAGFWRSSRSVVRSELEEKTRTDDTEKGWKVTAPSLLPASRLAQFERGSKNQEICPRNFQDNPKKQERRGKRREERRMIGDKRRQAKICRLRRLQLSRGRMNRTMNTGYSRRINGSGTWQGR